MPAEHNPFPIHEHLPVAEQAAVETKVGELSDNLTTLLAQRPDYWERGPDNRFFAAFPAPDEPDKMVDLLIQFGDQGQPPAYNVGVRSALFLGPTLTSVNFDLQAKHDSRQEEY